MKTFRIIYIPIFIFFAFISCEGDIDKEDPIIDLTIEGAFPVNCDTLYFGETFKFKVLFSDNVELGSQKAFNIDIHNNFDHHSHSTEVIECNLNPVKDPVNPYLSIESYDIPEGLQEYEADFTISIPSSDGSNLYDEGDYHFFISLADKEGWVAQKGLSIKMYYRFNN